jgi:ADP-L-glycero-D-manno-heptose 6-epimerase
MTGRFVVTGGAGFIGSNIVEELNRRGEKDITVVDRLDSGTKSAYLDSLDYSQYFDKDEFRSMIRKDEFPSVDTVFHMGACSSTTETDEDYLNDNNYLYSRELCEWCMENRVRFVYASSAATYGDGSNGYSDSHDNLEDLEPLNPYGRSKHIFDLWALENGLLDRIAGLKYFNVYGPREDHKGQMRSVVHKAYGQVLEKGSIALFRSHRPDYRDGEQKRDFLYVKDAVDVTLFFHDNPGICGLFNCGTGKTRTWLDLAHAVFSAMERKPDIRFIDMPPEIREKYQYFTQADIRKLRAAGYKEEFFSLENGVDDYVKNYLQNIIR